MTLFEQIKNAGIPYSNHSSDLYVKDCEESRAILNQHPLPKANARTFINQQNQERWIDIPFNYMPFWENVNRICAARNKLN